MIHIKNFFTNKLNIIITILILIILIFILILILPNEYFSLIGNEQITINQNDIYTELGVIARNKFGKNIKDSVLITGKVNTSTCGDYKIIYTLNNKTLIRNVKVICPTEFKLQGKETINILIGGKYQEEGVVASYQNKDYSNNVIITNNIDYNKKGEYYIEYQLDILNKTIQRKVIVDSFDDFFTIKYDNNKTNKLILDITFDSQYFSYYTTPDGNKISNSESTYEITNNGKYTFILYDNYGNSLKREISITNIDDVKLVASCEAIISYKKTNVIVKANKKINKYIYNGNISNNNNYIFNNKVENVIVELYDEYNDITKINCINKYQSENMEVHFINSSQPDDAILIRTDDKVIFIDGGSHYTEEAVLTYLKDLGITKIDALIGSHLHSDHIQTQAFILDNFTVDSIYYPDDIYTCLDRKTCVSSDRKYILDAIKKYNKKPTVLKPGDTLKIGEMSLYFLAPWKIVNDQNGNSFIFILKFRNNSFMFTGDTESTILNSLDKMSYYASSMNINLDIDVFKWPHHGTRDISKEFIQTTTPKYVIVPNYHGYGKPTSSMKTNFNNLGIPIYEQKDYGNILFISNGDDINVITNTNPSDYKR